MCLSVIFFLLCKIVCLTYKSAKIFYSKKYDLKAMVSTIFTDTVKSFNILQDVVIQTHVGNPSILQTT